MLRYLILAAALLVTACAPTKKCLEYKAETCSVETQVRFVPGSGGVFIPDVQPGYTYSCNKCVRYAK